MARRIEVELTSSREDGTWTWRAAGARQPKGDLMGTLLYEGAAVGDVVKVEAEFLLDGIEITEVFPPKKKKDRGADLLEMKSRPLRDDELVTEVRAKGRGGGRRDGRRDGRREGGRDGRREGGRDGRRGPRRNQVDDRPKPKRLRPRRTHRDAVLAEVPEEHRPIAEQVMQGGLPAVRAAIEKQNSEAKAEDKPEVNAAAIIAIAEPLVPKLQGAEWRDRADAALADVELLDLRDLRSVVVASDGGARDDESRALAEQLRTALSERIEADHSTWLKDLQAAIDDGRTVRALRLSSRPVKAGAPLPTELANRLSAAASAALADDVMPDRWATVVDALAYTPIRSAVTPAGYPAEPTEEMLEAIRRVADRVPEIAAHYNIDPSEAAKAKKRRSNRRKKSGGDKPKAEAQKPDGPKADRPRPGTEKPEAAAPAPAEEPVAEETAPAEEAAPAEDATQPEEAAGGAAADVQASTDAAAEEAAAEPEGGTEPAAEAAEEPTAAEEEASES